MTMEFPNGFEDWVETHHVIVQEIAKAAGNGGLVDDVDDTEGMGGLWILGRELTDEFEKLNEGVLWGESGREYFDELYLFLNNKSL